MNKTRGRAGEILDLYVAGISRFGFVKSVVLVGSLSDDTYTGNAGSDIDLINVIETDQPETARRHILAYIREIEEETGHDIPISRTVYQLSDLSRPYRDDFAVCQENKDYIELPIEVLRMKDTGKVVYGEDIISSVECPTRDDVIRSHERSDQLTKILAEQQPEWYAGYLKMIETPTIRIMAQIVITNAMSDYFLITGKNCSSKYRVLSCVREDIPEFEYLPLLALCHKWRYHNNDMTENDLRQMEREYRTVYRNAKRRF